ncbi:MAG: AEC family transporter [Candidatus Carbobacillus sp.]|nr:AEC family transporter [Candidatus Carbobacillus sp.]
MIFVNVLLPVVLMILVGYVYRRVSNIPVRPLAHLSTYILSPALLLSYLSTSPMTSPAHLKIAGAVLLFTAFMYLITELFYRLYQLQPYRQAALLTTLFPNTANYGLPVLLFAYGDEGLKISILVVVVNFLLMYTIGLMIAASGSSQPLSPWKTLLHAPTTYAMLLGLLLSLFHIPIPDFIALPLRMIGEAMIPVALMTLGMQLYGTRTTEVWQPILLATMLRLLASPLVMFGVVWLLKIDGLAAKVLIVQNATSAAVLMTMFAAEYDVRPGMVANITLWTTVLSFMTLMAILYILEYLPI